MIQTSDEKVVLVAYVDPPEDRPVVAIFGGRHGPQVTRRGEHYLANGRDQIESIGGEIR